MNSGPITKLHQASLASRCSVLMTKAKVVLCIVASLVWSAANSSSPGEQLALDTYNHLQSQEAVLGAAIKKGRDDQFRRFVENPTIDLLSKWPTIGSKDHDRFIRCRFALDNFRIYAADQYKARGALPLKTSISARDYFDQKAHCKRALAGNI